MQFQPRACRTAKEPKWGKGDKIERPRERKEIIKDMKREEKFRIDQDNLNFSIMNGCTSSYRENMNSLPMCKYCIVASSSSS